MVLYIAENHKTRFFYCS